MAYKTMLQLNVTSIWNLSQVYTLLDCNKMITRKEPSMYLKVNMYYESLWNYVVTQQGIFNRLKITYYIASSMNKSQNS